ncbi:F-box domain-containing protein [Mycena indigotica]|uniref:F-box domain-containing protein n=1 Tax=Mycena indigotica TaxID=2126181 RepID=A0A8H6S879_9AGAR|nr:F-box domain-containing protein [Mycena indigotica]KAF7294664.1 F-box domain-containing protein [Mycena indigotica]
MANISSIPIELTQRIMIETLAASLAPGDAPLPLPEKFPLLFTQISTAWRNISLNTPQLWAAIKMDKDTKHVPAQVIVQWASRAETLPLTIVLDEWRQQRGAQLLSASMQFCGRWQYIHLRLDFDAFTALVAHNGSFPLLQNLMLSMTSRLDLRAFPDLSVETASPIWQQLTTLQMEVHDELEGLAALQRCINLQELHLALIVHRQTLPSMAPILLPALRFLDNMGMTILPFVTAPNLVHLGLWGPGFGPASEMEQLLHDLRELVTRSSCTITRLMFRFPPSVTTVQLQTLLEIMPSVVDLHIVVHFAKLQEISTVLRNNDVLPRLRILRLMYGPRQEASDSSFQPLVDLLQLRRQDAEGRVTLEEFYMNKDPQGHPDEPSVVPATVQAELLALGNQGLRVELDLV